MSEVLGQVDKLSPERRALLQKILRQRTGAAHEPDAIRPRTDGGPAPLSFAQERLWFIDQLEPGSTVYNICVAWRLGGALDEAALERALGEVVRRHESLRTTFGEMDGAPVQVVAPFGGFALPVEDLSDLSEADREAAARRRAGEEARRAFDLAAGPLFRAALLRLDEEDHVLLLSMHHIVGDGWSTGVLFRELSALYAAYREGGESPLPDLPVQYADYAAWQREQLAGEALERQLAYWRERLTGAPELLELPTDHPRPPVQTYRGASVPVELPLELLERLQALALSDGATLYMVLLGAFQVLLSKYSGGDDIVVGSPIAGRTRKEVEELIGFFVNTLVLRTDLGGDPSFREILGRVREATLGAYAHQEVPFEKLVAELQPERSLSHAPLFQVTFTLQNAEGRGDALAGLEVSGLGAALEIAKFDLSLTLSPTAQGLRGALNYSTDLFERGTIERMLGHLARVLEQVAADADVRLSQLELLGEEERALVLEAWNRTDAEYPADRCIHQLFEAQAARTPGAVAVRFEDASLTYRELNERANRLAHHLVRLGVGPEMRVGICLERSLDMVAGILAVLKAGGAYVPLDPANPQERLAFILGDSATPVLITRDALRGALPAREGVEVVSLDGAAEEIAAESAENLRSGAGPDSLAYVIYTSGSTGAPKGALIGHRNVARLFTATDPWFGFGPDDVWTLFHSYAFDFSVWELWGALLYGGRVVVVPELVSRDPEAFHALVQREGVTMLSQTPSAFRQFARVDGERGGDLALRTVVFGGEALEPASLREWVERRGIDTPRLVNMYGITETTVHVTYRPLAEADVFGGSGSPIGVRIPDLQLYVCDSALRPLPVGVPGELYVGGGGVARGYLNRPELTAQRFVENPFGPGTLYRTGDRVRWLADGTLDYMGRLDEQVKIRGFRIELGEIEAKLAEHPEVREAVVLAREDAPGEKRLVAYVVGDAEAGVLREHLRGHLPEYMVPAAFVALDALPLTPNGKLDRKALPAPEGDAYARRGYEAPVGEAETALAEIWSEVLGVERVGRWDQFFELGGHSLLAIKLIERMRRAGLHADVRALFTTPVLAELARVVGRESSGLEIPANRIPEGCGAITPDMLPLVDLTQGEIDRIVAGVPGGAANVQDIYPLAPLQEGILFHHLMSEEGDPYLLSNVTEFDTRTRLEEYLAALQAVVDRHDILRTAVAWEGLREPVQVVCRHAPLPVEEVELDEGAEDAAGQLWRRYDPRRYRMDLGKAPLLRACIAEDRARGRWLLLMLTHHLTSDHESLEVQREEITAHLRGLESGLPAPLPFRNYVAQARLGVSREEHERFFGDMLADVEEPTAPYGLLDVWGEGRGMGEAWLPVASDVATRLRSRARALGVSAASLCHLAWAQVLARVSGRSDVVFGTLLFGRMQGGEGTDRVMGPFINTLPLRIGVGEEGVEAAVRRTHALLAELLRHEHASLSLAQRCSGVAAPAPLFTSLLNYRYSGRAKPSGKAGQPRESGRGIRVQERTNYPVALSVNDRGEDFSLVALVSAPADAERVCRMMHTALERLVDALEHSPGQSIGSIDVLPEADRTLVVEAWNGTAAEVPADRCIHELFEAQAERTPRAVAVVYEGEALRYAELNARANRLAHHLRGLGVSPEVRVGVLMERSLEMVVSLLAVLKAGGAYVPLDPGLPAERLAYMLEDSGVPLVLTQAALCGAVPAREGLDVLAVDTLAERLAAEPSENPAVGAGPDSLAYVIYTSGSTGRPKGVMNAHRGVVNRLVWMQAQFGIGADDVVLQKTPFGFDVSVWEFFWPLQQGARLVMARPDGHRDPLYLRDVVEREGVTTLHFVPSMLQPFVETVEAGRCGSLRHVVCSGEALPPALVARFYDRFAGPVDLTNLYGPTEAAVDVSCWTCPRDGAAGVVPIGGPVWNTALYVLDAALRPVPVGATGELYIGGVQVARGYLDRPGLTAERFVPDPFSVQGGARLYRTGDRARWRADGAIEYLGRLDFQVKIRGFRIELGEIETVLLGHPGVRESVVLAREDEPGEKRLVAYLVPDRTHAVGVLELQRLEREAADTGLRTYELPNGMGIAHLNAAETRFLYREIFEDRSYLRHGVVLGDGACVFDVGANIGLFTLFAGTLRPGVTVYAFEPIPPVFEALDANARIHGVDARLFNCGVGSAPGEETFTFYPHASVLSGRQVDEEEARSVVRSFVLNEQDPGAGAMDGALLEEMLEARLETERVTCEIRTLSQVIREQGVERIDLLKVDVEGGEYDVLAGIDEEHWGRISQVVAEARDQDLERVTELLARHGFAVAAEEEHGLEGTGLHTVYAVRPEAAAAEPATEAAPARGWSTPSALTRDLRELGRERLPEHMLPSAFVFLDALPLTPNGKLDRKALPAPEYASDADRYVAPRTPTEEVLAGIWAEVLRLERVGLEESFFELGGHSLLGTRVVSRVREVFGVELPLRAMFEGPTVAELAGRVEEMRRAGLPVLPPVVRTGRTGALPLSFAQERLWFLDRLEPGSAVYNIPAALRLTGALDEAALERALGEIVRRHESLRTTFAEADGSPVQVIVPIGTFVLPVEDLSNLSEADREAAVRRRARAEGSRPFDLSVGPLFRAALLRVADEEHVLLLCIHHIVSDGWSTGVLFREMAALYAAYREGRESPLPDLPVQYADYAVWQREQLAGEVMDRQLAYWRERMSGAPELLELPTDRPRPAAQTYRGATVPVEFSLELLERLQALARSEGATLYMTLLGAFQVLLGKYAGTEDVVVGSPIAGRTRGEVEGLIGFFVNTLVLRTGLSGDPGFREVLRRVRSVTLGAYEHQDVPFEKLVAELQPERSLSHSPLFQVTFTLQNGGGRGDALPGLSVSGVGAELASAKFDLALTLTATPQGLRGGLNYSTDLFERGTAERMLGHLARVLEQVAADADVRLSQLELLGEAERALVLRTWNQTAAEVPADRCIHELFEAQAARTPGAMAVRFEEASLTYAELNERANRLAHHLRGLGVGPEVRVGVLMERSLEMVISLLAVLKAGGAYVPLDPGLPAERLSYMLDDSGVPLVLVQAALRGAVPAREGVEALAVDALADEIAAESADNPAGGAGPDSLAYVIYTSGSTGRPKGVMNAHRGVVNRLVWMQAQFGIGADDVVLQKTPFGFDVSVWEFFWPLQQGARLVMARPDGHRDPLYLRDVVEREGVTTLHFVPSMLQPFVETVEAGRCASLRHVVCSGEALPTALVARFYDQFAGPVALTNLYGPTEAAVDVSCWTCPRDGSAGVVPIGGPVWNTVLYVLDAALRPVPVGAPGELYIGGVQVARGYLDRPGLTAERFVPDPFSAEGGARLYRTGDRARWRTDGAIEYLGRLDFQVKIRGFRIELGEIEAVLRRSESVADCVVVAREDEPGEKRLVAYLVPDRTHAAGVLELQRLEQEAAETGVRTHELPNGMGIAHLNVAETRFLYREIFEDRNYLRHGVALGDGACVFDVGANIGLFTLFASTLRAGVRVYAFEPIPPVFEVLEANARIHGVDARLFSYGVGSTAGAETFTFYPHASVLSGRHVDEEEARSVVRSYLLHEHDPDASGGMEAALFEEMLEARLETERVTCEIRTLSQVIREQGVERIDLLKVDVEGGEYEVLAGIDEEHWGRISQVVAEASDHDLERVTELLARRGFAVAAEEEHGLEGTGLHTVYAVRPEVAAAEPATEAAPAREWSTPSALTRDLRELGRERLPEHMVPAAYVYLDALPLTPNGKLDRKALPAPELASAPEGRYEAPHTPAEEVLAGIWAEVLGLERVGRWDHFFELGGHSLLAIKLIGRMRRAGLHADVRAVFTTPVLAELALAVGGASPEMEIPANGIPDACDSITPEMLPLVDLTQREIDRIVAEVPGGAANVQDIYPLAPLQEGILFHHLLSDEGDPYLMSSMAEFDTRARLEQYLSALQAVIDRHDILRTAVAWDGFSEPVQVVWRHAPLPVEEVELDAEDAAEELWRRYDPRHYRMDLGQAPLRRAFIAEDRGRGRWLLLMLTHHLTSDHESLEVQREEISAHLRGLESELPAPLPFRDYVAGARLGVSREEHERFFGGMLGDVEEPTAPYGLLDVWGDGRGIGEARLPVASDVAARLRRRARALGVSAASLCHLAWAQVLARLSGRQEVVFGTLLFGRMQGGEGTDRLMGPLINTLPVRIGVGEEGAEAAVRRTHALLADLLRHEHASLSLAQRCSGVAAPAPLFTSLLNYRYGGGAKRAREAGQPAEGVRGIRGQERTSYPVALAVDDLGEEFSLAAQVATPADAERVCRMMHTALERLVDALDLSPGRAIGSIDVLPEAERSLVLEAWNRTDAEVPRDVCVHERFEAQVERTPHAVALVYETEEVTYAELNARANRLAHHLRGLGVAPETRVGLCVERGTEMVVALLAVLKAGGAYVPLDPEYPEERLRYMLHDSAPVVLLTLRSLSERFDGSGVPIEVLDGDAPAWTGQPDSNPGRGALSPENLAYVIYTSGSTGLPKGVMNGHRNVINLLAWGERHWELDAGDALLQWMSLSFDVSVRELFSPLVAGARLVLVRPGGQREVDYLVEVIRRQEVSTVVLTPSATQAFLEHPGLEGCSSLRRIVLGGESIPVGMVAELRDRLPGARLYHEYGPTEATVTSTVRTCGAEGEAPGASIGGPISNARVYLLDARGEPVPVGVPGELYVGGAGVARGYLGRPALTAERFVPDSFGAGPGARLYRTGDLGRWLADGTIEFLGRVDTQVKVRGYRIELGEIEARLLEREGVRETVVVAHGGDAGNRRLVAYVVGDVEVEGLREHLRRTLPDYMVPAAFVSLERLPLTPSGKLDRRALPAPELASAEERYVAPRTPVEEVLAEIWAEMLRLERVGVTESFFELGGHSLLATRVVSRVRQVFGVELPLRALFEGPTVAELSERVEEIGRAGLPPLPPVVPAERTGALPLSFAQERLWLLDRLEPGSAAYNLPVVRRLGGALDEAALERALGEVVRRHEALRTVFVEADGSPVQVIAPFGGFALPVEDLSGLGEMDREAAVRRRAGDEAARAFDLSAGPLFRAALLRLGVDEHVLLLSMHHIVSDGWSMGVLFRELSALYAAYLAGRDSPLPELAVQYADYAVWQREQLEGEVLDRQLAYWRERLSGAPELLELPTDYPRPAVQTYRGATVPVDLSLELLERLQRLGRSEGATLYMVMLSAFQLLLSKYSGSDDIVVGSPLAGRTRGEVEELIGFFVNTLVLRTDLSGDPGFRETLRRVREATLDAYAHQEVPFEKLVVELKPERSLSHAPLFQVMFALQNAGGGGGALAGLKTSGTGPAMEVAKFDLSLDLAATPQGLRGGLNYSTDLFDRGTIERMLGHLERTLEQIAADADVRLSRLELLGEAEREQVLGTWNRTERESSDPAAHALFSEWARRAPEAIALLAGRESVTYGALDQRAAVLARHLHHLGVGPETPVGLCMERTPELLVGVLGIWKAGGAYVPLDPGYPAERLGWILADAALPVVVATGETAGVLPEHGATLVRVDQLSETVVDTAESLPEAPVSDSSLAYVIYTSGSTGTPKGVLVEHGSLSNLLAATRESFGVGAGDVMPALASYAFDIWLFEALLPLTSGAAVRLVERERVMDVPALAEEIADATLVHAVPALMRQMVHAERETPRLGHLRRAFVGGDRVAADLLAEMREALPGAETHVLYGPTEGTILASTHPVPADGVVEGHPIGRPLGNVRLYVCDVFGSAQPAGVPGELLIGGAGVARGYLGRSAMTAERFIPDPFSVEGGARLYRTGDRARWRADGTLEFLGRLDGQVKVRGFRIEPGEIEAVLRLHADVTDCAVVAREDVPGDPRLVAYVVGDVEADALREHVRESLPEYMLPSAFVSLEALPLTPNGKLDRKALPAPEFASAEEKYVAPRTPTEEVLAGIWAEVLRLERVGVEESFFELGGHSLLATRVVSRVSAVFGVELPLRALFEGPTVSELAGRVEEMRRAGLPVLPPVVPVERTGALPLSFAQERLWFIDRLEPESAAYNIPAALRLSGALDERALERALGEIIRRHESLRTIFAEVDGSPVPVISPFGGFTLPVEDLSGLGEADREKAVRRRAREDAARPFDLAAGPLFRAALLRVTDEEHVLLLCIHHIVTDGWSSGVLLRELSALYAAYREGRESPLPDLPVQYADYAVWQRQQLAGEAMDQQLAYWRGRMSGAPALLELPTDHPRPAMQTYRGATVSVDLSLELLERLQALGRSEGATLYMTLLGAFQVLLSKYAGSEDVVVGSPIAGRTRREVEELIGFFVNTLVLRTDLSGDPSFRETLGRVREATLGAYEHQEVPFEKLVAELQPERSLSHSPLFQVMFTLQDAGGGGDALPGLKASGVGAAMESAKFDLSLVLAATPQGLRGGLNYSTDLFERGSIERMLGHLTRVLEQVVADADVRLSRLELLGEAERSLVLQTWNRTDVEYPADRCIHELFEAQASRTPGAIAVVFEGEALSYAELNARANRLAHHLRSLGVRPDARVGICLERSLEMVVSLLAVLKAGGAYVPLDPGLPAERLAYMLDDSGVPLVLTQAALRGTVLAREGVEVLAVDTLAERLAAEPAENPAGGAGPDSLAYVIYTSGSTGRPKGVMNVHRGVVNLLWSMRGTVAMAPGDRLLAVTTLAFDISVLELFLPLLSGARVEILDRAAASDPALLREAVGAGVGTVLQATPATWRLLLDAGWEGAENLRALSGGEALPAELAARLRERVGALWNVYGPTETTIWSTAQRLGAGLDLGRGHVSIGAPVANTRVYVLDRHLSPVPAGAPGELYIGGAGVARGYLGRPGLSAEKFVPDPFAAAPGARLYRTGDLARWRPDGTLEFLGRNDHQVKVRGFRIELGEIEAVLRRYEGVADCVVMAREDVPGDVRLVAYVVGDADAESLRAHLSTALPEYMVPAAFVPLERLPLTPNGKLDRKALPAPEGSSYATRVYEAPRTEAERKVAAVWAEVLGVERVGAHDRFFDLGGHSLLLVRVQARLSEAFGQPVPITHLFRYLAVSALAAALDAPAPKPAAAPADDARVLSGRHRLRARGRASRDDGMTG